MFIIIKIFIFCNEPYYSCEVRSKMINYVFLFTLNNYMVSAFSSQILRNDAIILLQLLFVPRSVNFT